MNNHKILTLNVLRRDPHFGFPLDNKGNDLEVYKVLHQKGYRCLSKYEGYAKPMTVMCPFGHTWSGHPKKVTIPCNNCRTCWKQKGYTPAQKLTEVIVSRQGIQITPYSRSDVKVEIQCVQMHKFLSLPGDVMGGSWCSSCASNNPIAAETKFHAILATNGAKAIGPYINSTTPVLILCKNGHQYNQIPANTNMGARCGICSGTAKELGKEHFEQAVKERGGQILGQYINNRSIIPVLCPLGHIFQAIPYSITQGQWCAKCANNCPEQAKARFIMLVTAQNGKVLGPYITTDTKILIECSLGHTFEVTPHSINRGSWCPACRNNCPIQARERFEAMVASKNGTIIGPYVHSREKVAVQCERGHKFDIRPNSALHHNSWCRSCGLSESNGERLIREFLTEQQILYQREVCFEWLPRKRYDFAFIYNGRSYIIEFDGIQHFIQIGYFCPDEETFNKRRLVDIEKTIAALNEGYFLIRIAYSDQIDIASILNRHLHDLNPESRLIVSDMQQYEWLYQGVRNIIH